MCDDFCKCRYKFVGDMSILEVINLITCGLASYNFRNHVASDIATNENFLPSQNFESQNKLDSVKQWTEKKLMKMNEEKSKVMILCANR